MNLNFNQGMGAEATVAAAPGFTAQQFNCPSGSDFAASQEVGMCVDAAYNPVGVRATGGSITYYNLDGTLAGTAGAASALDFTKDKLIKGVPDWVVYSVGAFFLLMIMGRRR